jgi:hypothetical protein
VDADLLRVFIQTGTDDAKAVRHKNAAINSATSFGV